MENDHETKELYRKLTDLEKYRLTRVIIAEDFFIKKRSIKGKNLEKVYANMEPQLILFIFISFLSTASVQ